MPNNTPPRRPGRRTIKVAAAAARSVRIPITNIYDGYDYTALLYIGSEKTPVNVILDTGSSTLAVKPSTYHALKDVDLAATPLAQLVTYGTGGWGGPVIQTTVSMGLPHDLVSLPKVPLAITDVQQRGNFATKEDGILGLAYNGLNDAYDFKAYLEKEQVKPAVTYPWTFPSHSWKKFSVQFNDLVDAQKIPSTDVEPYFTTLERHNILANKFAFYTRRSAIHADKADGTGSATDPLNNGWFILGGGEEQKDLYIGEFLTVPVLHDLYYNTNLKSVQVTGCPAVPALPLQKKYVSYMSTNSIVDSGTSCLALAADVFNAILQSLNSLNPDFGTLIKESMTSPTGSIPASKLDLDQWPVISFILSGEGDKDVRLDCTPATYWQVNHPVPGQAIFQIVGPDKGEDQNQSILGLPLMNNYYCVFDRSQDENGVIRFAKVRS